MGVSLRAKQGRAAKSASKPAAKVPKVYRFVPAGWKEPVAPDVVKAAEQKLVADLAHQQAEAEHHDARVRQTESVIEQAQAILREELRLAEEHRGKLPDLLRRRSERQEHLAEADALTEQIKQGGQAREQLRTKETELVGIEGDLKAKSDAAQNHRRELEAQLAQASDLSVVLDCRRRLADLDMLEREYGEDLAEAERRLADLRAFDAELEQAIEKQRQEVEDMVKDVDHVLVDDPPEPVEPTHRYFPTLGGVNQEQAHEYNANLGALAQKLDVEQRAGFPLGSPPKERPVEKPRDDGAARW